MSIAVPTTERHNDMIADYTRRVL